jgi:GNAT superfamily N-acetyltransferase
MTAPRYVSTEAILPGGGSVSGGEMGSVLMVGSGAQNQRSCIFRQRLRPGKPVGHFPGETAKEKLLNIRPLALDEIDRLWTIDRGEIIRRNYRLRDGRFILEPAYFEAQGWEPGKAEVWTPHLLEIFRRGGSFFGMFDAEDLIGASVVDGRFIGPRLDWLVLEFLYVSRGQRSSGVGTRLFEHARTTARKRGAKALYVSATPTEGTVNFYLRRGCAIAPEPDPELLALEPEDIHLLCPV